MTHAELVERVARQLASNAWHTGFKKDPNFVKHVSQHPTAEIYVEDRWKLYVKDATAAIAAVNAALQEPSGEMQAIGNSFGNWKYDDPVSIKIWNAMLDASPLKEKKNG